MGRENKIKVFRWLFLFILFFCLGGQMWTAVECSAKKTGNNKITYTLEDGTFIVSGKGAVKLGDLAVTDTSKINQVKRIVVKKGITSIPEYAFRKFKKAKEVEIASTVKKIGDNPLPDTRYLEKVTLPGTFELATYEWKKWKEQSKYQDWGLWWWTEQLFNDHTKIKTICFNSKVSLKTLSWVQCENLIVSDRDPKYKSMNGVIYSKDGKSLVRVPSEREVLTVEKGCEEFCLNAVFYARQSGDEDNMQSNCEKLNRIVLPDSVKTVNTKKYPAFGRAKIHLKELEIETQQLDSESVFALTQGFSNLKEESIYEQLTSVSVQDGMYINTNDACMIKYKGNASEVTIPDRVKKIGQRAFYKGTITKVVMPDTVTTMNPGVFEECVKLSEVVLSPRIKKIPDNAFCGCKCLKEIKIPDEVTSIGKGAFYYCKALKEIVIPENVTSIDNEAFGSTRYKSMTLPAAVKKVGKSVFSSKLEKVTICGKAKGFDAKAFDECKNIVLHFRTDIREWRTWPDVIEVGGGRRNECIGFNWQKVSGVDGWQIQVSKDKSFQKKQTYDASKEKKYMYIENDRIDMRYVRIRPYKQKGKKKSYGRWSVAKV